MDLINGIFELIGAFFTWKSAGALFTDRSVKGVYWPTTAYFTAWGCWNVFYYPNLGQWVSFACGIVLLSGNVAWLTLLTRCVLQGRRLKKNHRVCWNCTPPHIENCGTCNGYGITGYDVNGKAIPVRADELDRNAQDCPECKSNRFKKSCKQ